MTKILVNRCFGGFSFSEVAIKRYAALKGLKLYPERREYITIFWTVPKSERPIQPFPWNEAPLEDRHAFNETCDRQTIDERPKDRTDPIWIQVFEDLGEKANGTHAKIALVEIPDNVKWEITEYDGMETVREISRTW
jgi:hypothetical protein